MSTVLLALLALQAAAPPPVAPTPVSPVVVEPPRDAPRLVRSYPAAGGDPAFGVLVLTLAFDQPMDPASAPAALGPDAPDCRPSWRLLADRKTFVRLCSLKAGAPAHLSLSGFRSSQAKPAPAIDLAFTADGDKVETTVADALKSAGLRPEDEPVMDWRSPPGPG
jgi:hypothetical protein